MKDPPSAKEKMGFSTNPLVYFRGYYTHKKVILTSSDSLFPFSTLEMPSWVTAQPQNDTIKGSFYFFVTVATFINFPCGISKDTIEFFTLYGRIYLEVQFVNATREN